jgi:sialate O-acetylesterase
MKQSFVVVAAMAAGSVAQAEVRLPGVFADHMVLQRESPVAVWGRAEAGEGVTVEFQGQRKTAAAAADGRWQVTLDPLKADANPASLTVSSSKGGQPLVREDIVVGEVWLIAGQSNAGMALKECLNPEQEIAAAADPLLRHMTNTHVFDGRGPRPDAECTWQVTTPEVAGDFHAVPYFFGRSLRRKLGLPVGVIAVAYGGSRIEAWMTPEALATTEWGRETIDVWRGLTERGPVNFDHGDHPAAIFNGKVGPLAPFAVAGSIWYQGENNASDGSAGQYADLMPLLIADWRRLWHRDDLPFLLVQLPNYTGKPHWLWPQIRQAVFDAAATVPHTRMIVTIDVGDPDDIHPKNKAPVGERLALQAMNLVYGDSKTAASGPVYRSATFAGGTATLEFDHLGGGLEAKDGPLREFTIAGADGKFVEAAAEIEGDRVRDSPDKNDPAEQNKIAQLTLWYSTAEKKPGFQVTYGLDYRDAKVNPEGVEAAFEADADGAGYVLEYKIPLAVLHAPRAYKPGDRIQAQFQVQWGRDDGRSCRFSLTDLTNPKGFNPTSDWDRAYHGPIGSGTAICE